MNYNYLLNKVIMFLFLFAAGSFWLHAGTVVKSELNSKQLNRAWKFTVYLPDSYNSGNERYPVIYLLHGNGDNENSWSNGYHVLDSLIANRIIPPVIAVTPSGKRGWWVNSSERFESAVINELIPFIDSTYKTLADRNSRMVFGYSMGGFGALGMAWFILIYFPPVQFLARLFIMKLRPWNQVRAPPGLSGLPLISNSGIP